MRGIGKTTQDEKWLADLGKNIERLIKEAGHESVYDFWISKAGDHISRSTLNAIVAGENDPKTTTLRKIAQLLKVPESKLFDF